MPHTHKDEAFRHLLGAGNSNVIEVQALARLKARIYSALIHEQQASGPLMSLSQTEVSGRGLCVFEKLVQIVPIRDEAKTPFFCRLCYARILGEKIEGAPINWANCPYANFQRR